MCAQDNRELSIWTVYAHPSDFPDCYVARRFVRETPTDDVLVAPTLNELRMMLPPGLYRMPRNEFDEVNIVEVWI